MVIHSGSTRSAAWRTKAFFLCVLFVSVFLFFLSLLSRADVRKSEAGPTAAAAVGRIVGWTGFQIADYYLYDLSDTRWKAFAIQRVLSGASLDTSLNTHALRKVPAERYVASVYPYSLASNVPVNEPVGSMVIQGKVFTGDDIFLHLLGGAAADAGVLAVEWTHVPTHSGDRVALVITGNKLLSVGLDKEALNKISSAGPSEGNRLRITTKNVSELFDQAINRKGVVNAVAVKSENGVVELISERMKLASDRPIQRSVLAAGAFAQSKSPVVLPMPTETAKAPQMELDSPPIVVESQNAAANVVAKETLAANPAGPPPKTLSETPVLPAWNPSGEAPSAPQTPDEPVREIQIIDRTDNTVRVIYLTAVHEMKDISNATDAAVMEASDADGNLTDSILRLLASMGVYEDIGVDSFGPSGGRNADEPSRRPKFVPGKNSDGFESGFIQDLTALSYWKTAPARGVFIPWPREFLRLSYRFPESAEEFVWDNITQWAILVYCSIRGDIS